MYRYEQADNHQGEGIMSYADLGCKKGDEVWWPQDWTYFTGTVIDAVPNFDGQVLVKTTCGKVSMRVWPSQLHVGKCPYFTV